jgi:putative ABC transport system substrate-binding protein
MQIGQLKRREFITLLGGAAAGPVGAWAREAMPVILLLSTFSSTDAGRNLDGLRQGLNETGYSENQNVVIEYRWAEGHYDRLPGLMADLVGRRVSVIVAWGLLAAQVAKAATSTIPIVLMSGDDPIKMGLVPSMNRPGGNVTGVYLLLSELGAKKLGLLHDLLPRVAAVGVLLNPNSPTADAQTKDFQLAGHALGLKIQIVNASSGVQEIDAAFEEFSRQNIGAVIISSDPSYLSRRDQIVALTARHAIPAVYELRQYVDAGGLMSYGTDIKDANRVGGIYVGRILKGEKPSELPVVQATKFELVINLKTAKALGINISDNVLSLADEVIE